MEASTRSTNSNQPTGTEQLRSVVVWILGVLRDSIGISRMIWIAFQTFLGSVAISLTGFSTILVLRLASPNASQALGGVTVPDIPLAWIYAVILVASGIGAFTFFHAEKEVSRAAVDFGEYMRTQLGALMSDPDSRGWRASIDEPYQQILMQTIVSDVREATMAARAVIRLIGPVTTLAGTAVLLFYLQPMIALALIPIAAILSVPVFLINRRIEKLNVLFEQSADNTRLDVHTSLTSDSFFDDMTSARLGDQLTHDRMLEPLRMSSLTTVSTAVFAVAVLGLFIARVPEGENLDFFRLILFVIVFRLFVNAAKRIAIALLATTRRARAVERYRQLIDRITSYQAIRKGRSEAPDPGASLAASGADGHTQALMSGQIIRVLVKPQPGVQNLESMLVLIEDAVEMAGGQVDLLGCLDRGMVQIKTSSGTPSTDQATENTYSFVVYAGNRASVRSLERFQRVDGGEPNSALIVMANNRVELILPMNVLEDDSALIERALHL